MFYHEEEIAQSLLAINHYRFTDYEDVKNKCAPDSAVDGYQRRNCVAELVEHSNYPEIYDEIMLRKWRRDAEEAAQRAAFVSSAPQPCSSLFSYFRHLWRNR